MSFDLRKIEKAIRSYSDQGKQYLVDYHIPGLAWSETERARSWCKRHVRNYHQMVSRKDECLFCTYGIYINGVEAYRGSSIKPFSRGLIHLAVIYNNPSLFGLTFADLDKPNLSISFKVHGSKLYKEDERKVREYAEIAANKPLLMKADGTDELIDIKQRRAVVKKLLG